MSYKLVLIEWVDAHAGRGWIDIGRIKKADTPLYCRSVGWLVAESKDCKVIVPHISAGENRGTLLQGCGDLTIPKKAIVSTTVLRRG